MAEPSAPPHRGSARQHPLGDASGVAAPARASFGAPAGDGIIGALEQMPVACFGLAPDFAITFLNREAERMLHQPRAQLLGRNVWAAFPHAVGTPFHAAVLEAMRTGVPVEMEECFTPSDTWIEVRAYPTDAGLICYVRDVTERRRRERELSVARERYRTLVEALPAITYVFELGADGPWTYVSPQIEAILGFSPSAWLTDPGLWARRIHPEDRERTLAAERLLGSEGKVLFSEYRMLAADGRVVWVQDEAAVLEGASDGRTVHGVMFDVTARKQAEEALERRARQQAVVAELGQRALQGLASSELLDQACELVASSLNADRVEVLERLKAGDELIVRAGHGWPTGVVRRTRVPAEAGTLAAMTLATRVPVVVGALAGDTRFFAEGRLTDAGVASGATVLVGGRDRTFGVLGAYAGSERRFSRDDVHFLQAVANVLADAIDHWRTEEEVRHRALHDALTGLPNRTLFVDRLRHALARTADRPASVAVLFMDVDQFKLINDSLGHEAGDQLLQALSLRLGGALAAGDTLTRFGGDEFVMLCEDIAGERDALRVAERVKEALAEPFLLSDGKHFVTTSIGVAVARVGESPDGLLRDADAAMYRAKERGRNRYELFDEVMRARVLERMRTEQELHRAIEQGELCLHLQPIVALDDGRVTGVEALARWQHPERGLVPPCDFIPVAEECGLIVPLGEWVLRQAARECARLRSAHPALGLRVSVNLSARQIAHPGLVEVVESALADAALPAEALVLELTESVLMEESDGASETFRRLKQLGIELHLDDFGVQYSSLGYLKRFPLDALKVDRRFTGELDRDGDDAAIVGATIAMAHALGLRVVAEGVETPTQLARLRTMGCDLVQGFLFSCPLPLGELEGYLAGHASARRTREPAA